MKLPRPVATAAGLAAVVAFSATLITTAPERGSALPPPQPIDLLNAINRTENAGFRFTRVGRPPRVDDNSVTFGEWVTPQSLHERVTYFDPKTADTHQTESLRVGVDDYQRYGADGTWEHTRSDVYFDVIALLGSFDDAKVVYENGWFEVQHAAFRHKAKVEDGYVVAINDEGGSYYELSHFGECVQLSIPKSVVDKTEAYFAAQMVPPDDLYFDQTTAMIERLRAVPPPKVKNCVN